MAGTLKGKNYFKVHHCFDLYSVCRYLTTDPHVAGRPRQYELARWVRDKFLEFGFDDAEISTYNVLLSYPSEKVGEESVVGIY